MKPVLHTTEKTVEGANQSFEKTFTSPTVDTKAIEAKVNKTIEDVNRQVQVEVRRSFHTSKVHGSPEAAALHPAGERERPPDRTLHAALLARRPWD